MKAAYTLKDLKEFRWILRRTGYKNLINTNDGFKTTEFENLIYKLHLKHFRTSRNLLFERDNNENLFEYILRTPGAGNSSFISLIWTECELWRTKDVLIKQNPLQKLPIDYIIESNDEANLFAFLVFDFEEESETVTKSSKKYFLKIKNEQFLQKTKKTLFQHFYKIIDVECEHICFLILEKLLKEMKQIIDIRNETSIDEVLTMKNEKYKHKFLNLLVTYWKPFSKDYFVVKSMLSEVSPFYKLILLLKENHIDEFREYFPEYLKIMKVKFGEDCYVMKVQRDCNSLLTFALGKKQKKAIEKILECEIIDANQVQIKTNNYSYDSKIVHFVMLKLLEKGYFLGNNDENRVPSDWISASVLEEFLDSRVQEDGIHGCKIDYNFLIDPTIREKKCVTYDDEGSDDELMFSRSIPPLQTIVNNERLKKLITHPVLSLFITLKSKKFNGIFKTNFYIFMLLYMVPFFMLVTLIPYKKFYMEYFENYGEMTTVTIGKKTKIVYKIFGISYTQFSKFPYKCCVVATSYLTLRESFQLFFVTSSLKNYLKLRSNQLEIMIITLSWILLWLYKYIYNQTKLVYYTTIPSAFIILLGKLYYKLQ